MSGPDTLPVGGSGAMFDRIATRYDLVNRVISLGLDEGWRAQAAEALAPASTRPRILDLATGTGDLAVAIARKYPTASVVGLDPSSGMLDVARAKIGAAALDARISLIVGDAQQLPFDDASFDGATIAFGIRNVPDRPRALAETKRVLRPGARLVVLELAEPNGLLGPLARWHVHRLVPTVGAWLSGAREYDYLQRSIARFPTPTEFATMMSSAGLETVSFRPLTFGAATLYTGVA